MVDFVAGYVVELSIFCNRMVDAVGLRDVLAENFKACRADKTQRQVAADIGVALRVYQNWEGGHSLPELSSFEKAAEYFGRPVSWFYEDHSKAAPVDPSAEAQLVTFAKMVLESRGYITLTPQELQDRLASITVSLFSKGPSAPFGLQAVESKHANKNDLKDPEVLSKPAATPFSMEAVAVAHDVPWELLGAMATAENEAQVEDDSRRDDDHGSGRLVLANR